MKWRKTYTIIAIVVVVLGISAFAVSRLVGERPSNLQEDLNNMQETNKATDETQAAKKDDLNQTAVNESNTKSEEEKKSKPIVRGLYLTGWTVGSDQNVQHYIDLANETEINSYVIDIKDDDGLVGYRSEVPEVLRYNAWQTKYNPDRVLKRFKEEDIYIIGRLVVNKDPVYARNVPQNAIKTSSGTLWLDNYGRPWIDPYVQDAWDYTISIAKEAIEKGFDEIQFDYIRFANDGNRNAMDFTKHGEVERHETINAFLSYAREKMPDVPISADVFGIILESPEDTEKIGQYLEKVGQNIHAISPMVYPSHYANNQVINGVPFPKPDLEPYQVVYQSLVKAKERIEKVPDYMAVVRPYLQDFTASWLGAGNYKKYGAEDLRAQIQAVYDAGYEEWLVWNANNRYSEEAFLKLSELDQTDLAVQNDVETKVDEDAKRTVKDNQDKNLQEKSEQ